MKKFLSLAIILVLVSAVFIISAVAASSPSYWSISSDCLVKSKVLDDGRIPTFKEVKGDQDGLLVGLPTSAKLGDAYFQAKDDYSIKYFDNNNKEITAPSAHIGTTDVVKVYDSNSSIVAEYGIVTYGDADGDGVFDVLDAYVAALCVNGFIFPEESPAVYEAVKPRISADNEIADVLDYQQIVNDTVKDDSQREENLKGRKYPIDQTMSFESVIYACDSKAKSATVSFADNNFKDFVSLSYNGSATAPSASGIYAVSANVSDSDEYLVEPGKVDLGFIVIAPKNGTGYTTIVDNENKKITIDITKPNATGADLTGYINSWVNPAYNLAVSSKNVANSTELAGAMNYTTYKYYKTTSNKVSTTDKTISNTADTSNAMLGCYLPDDNTLWTDNAAAKTVPVSVTAGNKKLDYTISFKQNEGSVEKLKETLLMGGARAAGARGQRSKDPATGASMTKSLFVECKRRYTAETGAYENITRIAYYVPSISFLELSMALCISGTGFKTILLGDVDTIGFMAANQKSQFTDVSDDNITLLYDTTKENLRYSAYTTETATNSEDIIMALVDKVLSGMNLDIDVSTSTKPSELGGKSGWCRYVCADDSTGLRYTTDYLLEFMKIDSTQDKHRTLLVQEVEGCTITTDPSQAITQKKDSNGNVTEEYYHRERMTQYEVFRVNATLKEGYKLSVKDANGNDVPYEAEHDWYIMPASDVTVTAVPQ